MIWSTSLFETTSVNPNPNIFFWIAAPPVDTTVNPNDIKMLLANGFSTFLSKDKPVLNNGPETLPRNSPNYIIIDSWVFKNFTLFDEALPNPFQILQTCVSVNNNLCRKLVSSMKLPIIFDKRY